MKKLLLLLLVTGLIACKDKTSPAARLIFYLTDEYNSADSAKDLNLINTMAGVNGVAFVSKEEAKQIYLDAGNESWDKVLDENPLPESIVVDVKGNITTEQLNSLEKKISDHLRYTSSVDRVDLRQRKK
jgi:cell division protein FtsX